jgi:hypothetical protein
MKYTEIYNGPIIDLTPFCEDIPESASADENQITTNLKTTLISSPPIGVEPNVTQLTL